MSDIDERSNEYQFHAHVSKEDHNRNLDGLHLVDEIMETLYMPDYINVDVITRFLAPLDDLCCSFELTVRVTTSFVKYAELKKFTYTG